MGPTLTCAVCRQWDSYWIWKEHNAASEALPHDSSGVRIHYTKTDQIPIKYENHRWPSLAKHGCLYHVFRWRSSGIYWAYRQAAPAVCELWLDVTYPVTPVRSAVRAGALQTSMAQPTQNAPNSAVWNIGGVKCSQ